jgi:uncharacterized repeat protein (TIGR03803 family)
MKKLIILVLIPFGFLAQSQTISVPLLRGGEFSGGTILQVDATNGNYEATPMVGKIGNRTEGAENNGVVTTANSGIHYEASNNSLYITAKEGARKVGRAYGLGVIYRYDISSGTTHMIHEFGFDDSQGTYPFGTLQNIGGQLYGVTQKGGEFGFGTIYSINPSTDAYTVLFSFNGTTDGGYPRCQLFADGNVLYGAGGQANAIQGESFFSYDVSSSVYTTLHLGAGVNSDIKGLFKHNNKLYISQGDNINELDLANLSGGTSGYYLGAGGNIASFGNRPFEFVYDNGLGAWLTTFTNGGVNGHGTIAKINFNGTNPVSVLHSFSGGTNGQDASSKMTQGLLGSIYGLASQGSGEDYVLFEYNSTGVYSILHSFTAQNDGLKIRATPVLVGSKLYGIAEQNGQYGAGTIWSYDLSGGAFNVEAQLGYENGRNPLSGLVLNPITSELDFTVQHNSSNARGAINSFNATANSYNTITSLNTSNIGRVSYKPFYYNNKVLVLAQLGQGAIATYNSTNAIVEIDIATGDIIGNIIPIAPDANLANISNSIVQGNIIQENNMLYGGTVGLLFSFDLASMTYNTLHTYTGATDGISTVGVSMDGDVIFGVNDGEGANGNGAVYSYDLVSTAFTVLENVPTNNTYTGVVTSGDNLYTVKLDSAVGYSIAAMDLTAGAPMFSSVASIDSNTIGFMPGTNLAELNGMVYGIMNNGGANDIGGIFKFETATNSVSQVLNFDETSGFYSFNSELFITDAPNSIDDLNLSNTISIYPNPSNGIYLIDSKEVIEYSVYNNVGALVLSKTGSIQVDLTSYPSGIYLIKVETTNGELSKRLIKE